MTDPTGLNPVHYQNLYPSAVGSPAKDMNRRQPDSISDQMSIDNKPKSGDALLGVTTKDCKT